MNEMSIREARNALGNLDDILAKNGEMIITRHGKRIARIIPLQENVERPSHDDLRKKMGTFAVSSAELIREERDER